MYLSRLALPLPGDRPLGFVLDGEGVLRPSLSDLPDGDPFRPLLSVDLPRGGFPLFLSLGAGAAGAGEPVLLLVLPGTGAALKTSSVTSR